MAEEQQQGKAELRVLTTTALGAYPIENALVTVSTDVAEGERTLLYSVMTDSGGLTPAMTLDTPPRAESLSPSVLRPFAVYTVEAYAEGYTPVSALQVAMFDGTPALLPVLFTPLPEGGNPDTTRVLTENNTQSLYEGAPPA